MFEQLNMTKKLKRQISKAVSIALSAAMLVTGLPADLTGGIASVMAKESSRAESVLYTSEGNTTIWNFSDPETNKRTGGGGITNGETLYDLVPKSGIFSMKAAAEGLSMKNSESDETGEGDAALIIPLEADTTSVKLELALTSNNSNRWITVGDETVERVYLNDQSFSTTTELAGTLEKEFCFESNKYSNTYSEEYFTVNEEDNSKSLQITTGSAGKNGSANTEASEVKIASIKITEFKGTKTDFTTLTGVDANAVPEIDGYTFNHIVYHNNHGLRTEADGATMNLELAHKANVWVTLCTYCSESGMTANSGTVQYKLERKPWKEKDNEDLKDSTQWLVKEAEAGDLTLTFDKGSMYIHSVTIEYLEGGGEEPEDSHAGDDTPITYTSTYDFRDGSVVPTDAPGNTTVISDDGALKIEGGPSNAYGYNGAQHGCVFKNGNVITIHVLGNSNVFIGGCEYSGGKLTVTANDNTIEDYTSTKTDKCYHNDATAGLSFKYEGPETDLVMTFGDGTTYIPIITVERTELSKSKVQATVAVNDNNNLLQTGDTITLVNSANEQDVVDISSAKVVELKARKTYKIVSSNSDIIATVNGKKTVSTTTVSRTFSVDLTSAVVNPKVTISVGEDVAEGTQYTLTLVNDADETDKWTLANNENVKLKIGATYTLVYDKEKVKAKVNNSGSLTVNKDLTAISVAVSAPEQVQDDVITFTSIYDFRNGTIIPTEAADIKDTMTATDKKLTYKKVGSTQCQYNGAQHGVEFKADNQIIIHVLGKAKVFIGGCQYSAGALSITSGEEELRSWTAAEVKGTGCYDKDKSPNAGLVYEYDGEETDLVLNIKDAKVYIPIITVERTEPKPDKAEVKAKVTVKDDDHLLQAGDTIKLVNAADETDYHDITAYTSDGEDVELKINSNYKIVSSNDDIKATAKGLDTVATTTEDLTVEVTLEATVVHPTVTVSKAAGVPADAQYTLTLVNDADESDTHTLVNGEKVKLKIGANYKIKCDNDKVTVKINGSVVLAVNKDLTAFTVSVDVPDLTHHTYDVWDFGAEALKNTDLITYNNLLTVDIINGWFKGTNTTLEADGKDIDAGGGLTIASDGIANKWRLRTLNDKLKGETEDPLADELGQAYQGILYDNAGKGAIWLTLDVKAGDKVTAVVSSNGTASDVTWESPDGTDKQVFQYTLGSRKKLANTCVFTAAQDGTYKLYSSNEKLVVARIYRERPKQVTVSGKVTLPAGAAWSNDAQLLFTNQTTGQVTEATVTNANGALTYTVTLHEQYGYDVSLEELEGVIVGAKNTLNLPNEAGDTTFDVECIAVDLVVVTGSLADLTPAAAAKLKLTFKNDEKIYVPKITIDAEKVTYTGKFEKDVEYIIEESGVNDYTLETTTIKASAAGTKDIKFNKKPTYAINVKLEGPTAEEAAKVALTFYLLDENFEPDGYEYSFTGTQNIELRDGQYKVKAELEGYTQKLTSDVKVNGAAVDKTIVMIANTPAQPVPYKETITVSATGDYQTINDALDAVRRMTRTDDQRVTISIAPGDYEEMLVVDVPNVTLKNASATPSIALKNKGVDIDENAVRITSYYGHGYTYYSMGSDCKWDADLLAVNKENGYASFENPGSGTTSGSYWNATVVINADGFQAEGIIFENSFNQYMSKKAAEDVIVKQSSAKEGSTARADMKAGDTAVQNKAYVERAAALAIYNKKKEIYFDNCKFIGRQDTLYGGTDVTAAFYGCSIYGGTDYIFGGMTAVFAKCDLVFNTMEDNNDVGYITAAQQKSGRGYLMYNCNVTSTTPGVDTASAKVSKPGYFGRPWEKDTSEAVFYYTIIGTASDGTSLITPIGWNDSLSGRSNNVFEYKTYELTKDADGKAIDNSAARADWSKVLTEDPILDDNSTICVETFLGKWTPFKGKDMSIKLPDGTALEEPVENTSFDGWDKVAKPVIDDPTYTSGDGSDRKMIVKVTADVSDKGGQRVRVTVKKTDDANAAPQSQSSTKKQNKHTFEFTISGPGKYEITAALERKGKPDKVTTKRITINSKGQAVIKEGLYVELLDGGKYTYTGSAIKPAIAVYNGEELLKEGTDYTVKYSNNVKASVNNPTNRKDPTITVIGKGRFAGKTEQKFTIEQKSLEDDDVFVGGLSKDAANTLVVAKNVKLNPILVYKGVVLKVGDKKDFKLTATGITNGKPQDSDSGKEITIEGVNNYTGKLTLTLDVKEVKKITTVKIDKNKVRNYAYDGTEKEVPIEEIKAGTQKLEEGDYIIVPNGDLTSAGTQKFTVIGVGIYAGSKTSSFKINPRKINTLAPVNELADASGKVVCTYNSAGVTFNDAITVTDADLPNAELAELVQGKDYKVTYSGNKKVGTGKYTISFLGNYKGSKTVAKNYSFEIEAADLKDLEDAGELYAVSADKAYTKKALYKSAPYVLVNGVALKGSDYKVTYYYNDAEMKGNNKVELTGDATSTTVRVVIEGKKNYTNKVETTFDVVSTTGKTDISKAKITLKDNGSPAKKQSKVEYTGEAVYPYSMEIKVGTVVTTLKYDPATESWLTDDGTPTQDFDIEVVNNIAKGRATVIVTGTDNNVGSKTATFNVVSLDLKKVSKETFWSDFSTILSWPGLRSVR